tara:strand:+ start:542 stop:919 length:378 start_codon:yes stop_codon:yes gene_type:complete
MAVTVSTQTAPIGSKLVYDDGATAAASNDTTGDAGTLFMVEIDNTVHASSTDVFLKIVDANSCTPGTTAATMVLVCPGNSKRSYVFPEGIVFDVGFSHWLTTGATQANTNSPDSDKKPKVRYITS